MYDWEIKRCVRCDAEVNPDTAYKQMETHRLNGSKIKCLCYYCDGCARTLKACGAGELSDMQQRASSVSPVEAESKQD